MNPNKLFLTALSLTAGCLSLLTHDGSALSRERVALDREWKFQLGDPQGAHKPEFADNGWTTVNLPHDWSIGMERSEDEPSSGGGGFFPTGTGWYRSTFQALPQWQGKRVEIEFEGVYRNATVWINGVELGSEANGYVPFTFDLTPHLKFGEDNLLAVRVHNEPQPNSRWYTGSGIYRPVWLHVTYPVHIPLHGLAVSTWDLYPESATTWVELELANRTDTDVTAEVDIVFADAGGIPIQQDRFTVDLPAGEFSTTNRKIAVAQPQFWTPDSPTLYRAIARVFVDGLLTDRLEATFGIRDVRVSANRGLQLNRGETLNLFGGNVHHDNGPLGAAAFAAAEERKVRLLKEAGFTAVRTAHNLPSSAFLQACDRLGLMVVNEIFDSWASAKLKHDYSEIFHDHWRRDLATMVRRDRNHPSIMMWSIGNEMYERGSERAIALAEEMVGIVRQYIPAHPNNPMRLATAGVNGLGSSGQWSDLDRLFSKLDVAGYNYELERHTEDHLRVPGRVIYAAESYQVDAFNSWAAVNDHSYVIGDFVWSAIDYLGEAGIGRVFESAETVRAHWEGSHYPWHAAACGDIDFTGYRKPISWYRQIVWDRGASLYMAVEQPSPDGQEWQLSQWAVPPMRADWSWPGNEGKPIQVEVYSRHPSVRLYLNDKLIGEQPTGRAEQFKAAFTVPYASGTLTAVGMRDGQELERFTLQTSGPAAAIRLTPESAELAADGQDLAFIVVEVVDAKGRRVFAADNAISFNLSGPGEIIAVGSADYTSDATYTATDRRVFEGRALLVVRTSTEVGEIHLHAAAPDLDGSSVVIPVIPAGR